MRLPLPSVTNIGQIRSAGVSTFSATSRRDHPALRLRRMRTAGNWPASACGGARSGTRASGSARRGGNGLASGFMGAPLPWAASAATWVPTLWASAPPRQGLSDKPDLDEPGYLEPGATLIQIMLRGEKSG